MAEIKPVKLDPLAVNNSEPQIQSTYQKNTDNPQNKQQQSVLMVLGTTFITIFLAEIGDKTQLSTLLMSAESHQPWIVFIGSGTALVTTSLLGVLLGSFIASKLSPKTVEKSAGIMLLLISLMLVWDIITGH